ncbi:MAG: hypothetical protein RMJ56_12280 [Gemmataceae bacterium]|nr:hypothetical protein [Gemmata sp.]MDW8198370.1 hypothetical protein [Gemmataceae bacterium]
MARRLMLITWLMLSAGAFSGCASWRCGDRAGGLALRRPDIPCQTAGQRAGCYDAVTGDPIPCPPDVPAQIVPGSGGAIPLPPPTRGDELHMPAPSGLIPPQAIPVPAPPPTLDMGSGILPYPSQPGIPVKSPHH